MVSKTDREVLNALVDAHTAPPGIIVLPVDMTERGQPAKLVVVSNGEAEPDRDGVYMVSIVKISRATAVRLLGDEKG